MSHHSGSGLVFFASSRLAQSTSLTTVASRPLSRRMTPSSRHRISSSTSRSSSVTAAPYTEASGVRSSWEITAMNSSLSVSSSRWRRKVSSSERWCIPIAKSGGASSRLHQGDCRQSWTRTPVIAAITTNGDSVERKKLRATDR